MTVFDLKIGESAKISRINLSGGARARLNSLGFFEGATVEVISFSLFKSSVLVSCAAVRVGIRRAMASKIEIEK